MPKKATFKALGYSVGITEEIVRWCFEIANRRDHRLIIFTNPTAGPWKLVKVPFAGGDYILYQFPRDDERPDVILVCDDLATIYVIEAKETVRQINLDTIEKNLRITADFADRFSRYEHHDWKRRAGYHTVPGFLFGSASREEANHDVDGLAGLAGSAISGMHYLCAAVPSREDVSFAERGSAPRLF